MQTIIEGEKFILRPGDDKFPQALKNIPDAPDALYGIGNPDALREGIGIIGARRASEYGLLCTKKFSEVVAKRGITIISGGARGCDTRAHKAALANNCPTVAVLAGGCDQAYPTENIPMFQAIVDKGGCLISEHTFETKPVSWMFRARNRIVAALSKGLLVIEAGLPSGTFATVDYAIKYGCSEVMVVPGSIFSAQSQGTNQLIYQGATPVVDMECFNACLLPLFG